MTSPQTPSSASDSLKISGRLASRLSLVHRWADVLCNHTGIPHRGFIAQTLARLLLPRLKSPLACPTIHGFDLCVQPGVEEVYYLLGFYEEGTAHAIQSLVGPGDVFVDVGSSVGMFAMIAADRVGPSGSVLAFEPHPDRFTCLRSTVLINERRNLIPFQLGLADSPGSCRLYIDRPVPSMIDGKSGEDFIEVAVETLDRVARKLAVTSVDMIKIDVEGMERAVLVGAEALLRSERPPIICLEVGESVPGEPGAIRYLQSEHGYTVFQFSRTKHFASKLVAAKNMSSLRPNDNVVCFPPRGRGTTPAVLLA